MIVTDIIWVDGKGKKRRGFYMDGYLAENLANIPAHQKKDWDVIGIVSGSGKVRVAKSTISFQVAFFVAWIRAGGMMNFDRNSPDYGKVIKSPTEKVEFGLDSVIFGVDNLMKAAQGAPKMSIFVLDEEEGLGAKSQMMSINRQMERFMQECGVLNHFVIVVLPDFFSLNKEFATGRSNFLINTYIGRGFQRGFFSFFSEHKKEKLYVFGRKLLGNQARYAVTDHDFNGRFTKWLPFSREKYELKKREALRKGRIGKRDTKLLTQRDFLILLIKEHSELTNKELAEELSRLLRRKVSVRMIEDGLSRARKQILINDMLDEEENIIHDEKTEKTSP